MISVRVPQNNAICKSVEIIREEGRRDDVSATAREEATAKDTQVDLSPPPNWSLDEYHRECTGMMDVKRFDSTALDGRNLVVYDQNCFERDTAMGA